MGPFIKCNYLFIQLTNPVSLYSMTYTEL